MTWPRLKDAPVISKPSTTTWAKDPVWDMDLLLKAVEANRASYLAIHGWPDEIYTSHAAGVAAINLRLGYRFMPRAVTFPDTVRIGEPFDASVTWANAGVAPCYCGGFGAFTLKDDKGGIVAVLSDERFDLRDLRPACAAEAPATARAARFRIGHIAPATRPGTYDVFISVGRRDGTPVIALPLAGDDGQRRYKIGRVTLTPSPNKEHDENNALPFPVRNAGNGRRNPGRPPDVERRRRARARTRCSQDHAWRLHLPRLVPRRRPRRLPLPHARRGQRVEMGRGQAARPRPLLGFYDDSLPEVNDWHIKWAPEHGLSFFAFDWYWNAARSASHAPSSRVSSRRSTRRR